MSLDRCRRGALLGIVTVVAACGAKGGPTVLPASAGTQAARDTHENLNAVLWMQTAVEYRASAIQAYRLAQLQLDAALRDPQWTAATEQAGDVSSLPPAVILDLDETVIVFNRPLKNIVCVSRTTSRRGRGARRGGITS